MRKYTPKDSVQKQAYFTDRLFVSPPVPRFNPNSDEIFAKDFEEIKDFLFYADVGFLHQYADTVRTGAGNRYRGR